MSKHSQLVIQTYNNILHTFEAMDKIPCGIPSDLKLAKKFEVSRTTIHKAIQLILDKKIILIDENSRILLRKPKSKDFLPEEETSNSTSTKISKLVLQKLSSYELKPGARFSELELSKEFECSTISVRESLLKIAQSGIISKVPGQKWEVLKFTTQVINEIAQARLLYELEAIKSLKLIPNDDKIWDEIRSAKTFHIQIIKKRSYTLEKFIKAEKTFHISLIDACNNRFIKTAYQSVFLLVHYHIYQIEYDKLKIEKVIKQHLLIINLILEKEFEKVIEQLSQHLEHAQESMLEVNKMHQLS